MINKKKAEKALLEFGRFGGSLDRGFGSRFLVIRFKRLDPLANKIWFTGKHFTASDDETISEAFRKFNRAGKRKISPYFNLLVKRHGKKHAKQITREAANFNYVAERPQRWHFWQKQHWQDLPESYSIEYGDWDCKKLRSKHIRLAQNIFRLPAKKYFQLFEYISSDMATKLILINIEHNRHGVVATGGALLREDVAYLFSGGVKNRYRGRRLYSTLFAHGQMICREMGAKFFFAASEQPKIAKTAELTLTVLQLKKRSNAKS